MSSSSSSVPISGAGGPGSIAPTPQNTPLDKNPLSTAMSKPTLPPTIGEEGSDEDENGDADAPPETPPGAAGGFGGLGPKGHNAIMGLVQQRLQGLMGQSSGYIESLPIATKKRVLALKGVQTKYEDLVLQYKKETIELERKYANLSKPLFDRRLEIINGASLPTTEELEKGHTQEVKDHEEFSDDDEDPAEDDTTQPSFLPQEPILDNEPGAKDGIPQFWLTTLQNHSGISELITSRDEKALEFLRDIRYDYLPADGQSGFKLTFEFASNPFFENTTLTKTYFYQDEISYDGDFLYDRAEGTTINWKEDQDLTKEIEIKKQRNKHTNKTRLVRKARTVDSFFNFFAPPVPPSEEQLESGELDEEELEELDAKLELDYQMGEDFKDKIVPRAIDYFSGKALRYELDDDDYDDEDDEDEDDDEGSPEEEDEDEDEVPKKKGGKRGGGKSAAAGGDPQDCKQG